MDTSDGALFYECKRKEFSNRHSQHKCARSHTSDSTLSFEVKSNAMVAMVRIASRLLADAMEIGKVHEVYRF